MKTLTLQIDDSLYDALLILLKQMPESKLRITDNSHQITEQLHSRLGGMVGTGEIVGDIVEPSENLVQWKAMQ